LPSYSLLPVFSMATRTGKFPTSLANRDRLTIYSKYMAWHIGFPLPWGATNFVIGFIIHEVGAYQHNNIGAFISSNVMMFIAP
jgi:hypothetical protein